jgi:ubiquinone/menaquinone biosynthesis C-methylase UbiE
MVCPWWFGYFLLVPLRRLFQDPVEILRPHVGEGMTVLEAGPGMGFFTLDLARLVGPKGLVVAVDVQPRMLAVLTRRARNAGLAQRIEARLARADGLGVEDLAGRVGFVLAFAVVHEMADPGRFFAEAARALAPGGRMLLAEPSGHVKEAEFAATLEAARHAGLAHLASPRIAGSRTAVLGRAGQA